MSNRELQIVFEQLKAGMMLARDVVDNKGQILVARGTKIDEITMSALHRRDIKEFWIIDHQILGKDIQTPDLAAQQQHQKRLIHLFRHIGNSTEEHHLLDLMARYRGVTLS